MKDYEQSIELSYLIYWDVKNLYRWIMLQKLSLDGFKWTEKKSIFTPKFIQIYNDDSDRGCIIEINVSYAKPLQKICSDPQFLPDRMKIDKCLELVCNMYGKKNYVIHRKALKSALDYGLILEKVHNLIEFNRSACLKSYIEMYMKLT